jgi:beta-lactamase regulating signal transducer with metallopeptidase domain
MTDFSHLLATGVMRPLGWTLLHFLWQGVALAALGYAMVAVCRSSPVRYLAALATLLLMFAAPVVTFLLFLHSNREQGEMAASRQGIAVSQNAGLQNLDLQNQGLQNQGLRNAATPAQLSPQPIEDRASPDKVVPAGLLLWLVQLWFVGVAFFSLRTAGGFLLIERLRRKQAVPMNVRLRERCLVLQRRLGLDRVIQYCECQWLEVPAVMGWIRPVILVPLTALTGLSEEQLEAVIAHELAHVKRWDGLVNLFQVVAETLLFYHPAVWWMNQRIRAERENCCDDIAISICGDRLEYARALTLMEEWRVTPALTLAANSSPLAARVARLLGLGKFERQIRSAGIAASFLCLTAALLAGNAFLGVAHAALDAGPKPTIHVQNTGIQEKEIQGPEFQNKNIPNKDVENNKDTAKSVGLYARNTQTEATEPQTSQDEPAPEIRQDKQDASQAEQGKKESFIDGLKAAGLENLSVEQLVALKIHGVTPEYVRELQKLGLHLDASQLVGMKIQGVTPEYIHEMRAAGFNANVNQIVGMKIQGVTPEYVRELQKLGLRPDANQLVGMKIQGVTPEYIREMRAAGFNANVNQIVGMKIQGVTPEYVRELQKLGLHPDANQLVGMKIQGVTPEYVRDIRATGLDPTLEQLVGMRIQGVSAEYIKTMQGSGLKLKTEEYVAAKVMGITPEFIEKARSHGFKDLDLHKLIALKQSGVF